jgi:hypothetical protein
MGPIFVGVCLKASIEFGRRPYPDIWKETFVPVKVVNARGANMKGLMRVWSRVFDCDIGNNRYWEDSYSAGREDAPNFADCSEIVSNVLKHMGAIYQVKRAVRKGHLG